MNKRTLAHLKRQLKQARPRITQDEIASVAGVQRTCVCHVLAGRGTSANVIAVAYRLLSERAAPERKAS